MISSPRHHKSTWISYLAIACLLFMILAIVVFGRGIMTSLSDSRQTIHQTPRAASEGATKNTGAPTKNTNTPADRTVPSPSGGDANTILNPNL